MPDVTEAFEKYLGNLGEDAGDDLISLAEEAFRAGWEAREQALVHQNLLQ